MVSGVPSPEVKLPGREPTTHFHPVPRSGTWSCTSTPLYVFMASVLNYLSTGTVVILPYLYFTWWHPSARRIIMLQWVNNELDRDMKGNECGLLCSRFAVPAGDVMVTHMNGENNMEGHDNLFTPVTSCLVIVSGKCTVAMRFWASRGGDYEENCFLGCYAV
jgi:hypothetical protein